jgi:hypothetical protein
MTTRLPEPFNSADVDNDAPGIVYVVAWFDDEQTEPASYVIKLADGGYEAKVFDMHAETELSLGVHATCDEARRLIWEWNDLDRYRYRFIDPFGGPKGH